MSRAHLTSDLRAHEVFWSMARHCLVHCNHEGTGFVSIIARSLGMDTHIGIAFITNIIIGEFASVSKADTCNSILRVNMENRVC